MTEANLQALRNQVWDDAALQARLFALDDADEFVAAVCALARSLGIGLEDEELRQAIRAGGRAWFERKLP